MSDDLAQHEELARHGAEIGGVEFAMVVRAVRVVDFLDREGELHCFWETDGDRSLRGVVSMLEVTKSMVLAGIIGAEIQAGEDEG